LITTARSAASRPLARLYPQSGCFPRSLQLSSKRWYLTRRFPEEDSVACLGHSTSKKVTLKKPEATYLSTVFLANRHPVN
jgi:hypothetical protein